MSSLPDTTTDESQTSLPRKRVRTAPATFTYEQKEPKKRTRKKKTVSSKKRQKLPQGGKVVCASDDDFFWEIDKVVGQRKRNGRHEFLIKWKGSNEKTWEPPDNLCDTAMADAIKFVKEEKRRQKEQEKEQKQLRTGSIVQPEAELSLLETTASASARTQAASIGASLSAASILERIAPIRPSENVKEMESFQSVLYSPSVLEQIGNKTPINPKRSVSKVASSDPAPTNSVEEKMVSHSTPVWNETIDDISSDPEPEKIVSDSKPVLNDMIDDIASDPEPVLNDATAYIASDPEPISNKTTDGSTLNMEENTAYCLVPLSKKPSVWSSDGKDECIEPDSVPDSPQEDPWKWTDEEQVHFRPVQRINVNDSDSRQRVTSARVDGIPVVLTGHVGWANFAKEWLRSVGKSAGIDDADSDWLDLSRPHEVDVSAMIDDIGLEDVPVVERNYNEESPIHDVISASTFLEESWCENAKSKSRQSLYLHQWQFPLSDTAGRKLCHKNNPLPNGILGEDLLRYWQDLPQCKGDSPLQYIFMGREGTMSKLHRDNGGLDISIAPIVGEKECILVHRADGSMCLYNLTVSLDDIDLQLHPLISQARIWKTTVCPGEILLMPHGTYHQCRNVTKCLSYSRFHLDTVNLRPFLESMLDEDAPEVEHDLVIWNCTHELIDHVNDYVDHVRAEVKTKDNAPELDKLRTQKIETLRVLRNICKEVARRISIWQVIKRKRSEMNLPSPEDKSPAKAGEAENEYKYKYKEEVGLWDGIVNDIDKALHRFRYRKILKCPKFQKRGRPDSRSVIAMTSKCSELEQAFTDLPSEATTTTKLSGDELVGSGESVIVHIMGKNVKGTVLNVDRAMHAALLTYENYPGLFDEYQPVDKLRAPNRGGVNEEISPQDLKTSMVVVSRSGNQGEEYRARVESLTVDSFCNIRLDLGSCHMDRWLKRESIMERLPSDQNVEELTVEPKDKREEATNVAAIATPVEVGLRLIAPPKLCLSGDLAVDVAKD